MAIRISRNEEGNCITFIGSSNPAYWNSCLSAVLSTDTDRFHIINDLRSANDPEIQYEFFNVLYTDFADADGNAFTDAADAVDYINANANVIGLDGGTDMTGVDINFRLDQTSTTILSTTGSQWGVNSVKAVAESDGTIHIHAIGEGIPTGSEDVNEKKFYRLIDHTLVSINGTPAVGGLQDVTNALNELFTVGAFEAVVIADPYSTMVADVAGVDASGALVGQAVNPSSSDIGAGVAAHYNQSGWLSTDTIDQAGEYFTFDIRNEGIIGMGLVVNDVADVIGSPGYGDPAEFCDGAPNSGHYGYQFGHFFHPTPNGPWTNYGASTAMVYGPGWSNATHRFMSSPEGADWLAGNPVKMRVGIDANGFISIDYYDSSESSWIVIVRTSYPTVQGVEYKLGIKFCDSVARLASQPKVHLLEPAAPTMYFRYVESPDGVYHYPLFATEEEAEYYDEIHNGLTAGTGSSHPHVYADDPTYTTWYMPEATHDPTAYSFSVPPSATTFNGNPVTYTEVTTLVNADLAPAAFTDTTITVDELSSVNYVLAPADAGYTTTIGGAPNWTLTAGTTLTGTAPEVTGDTSTNPSDTTTVTVYRTNAYGSTSGTLTIEVTNLTAPTVVPIAGVTHEATSDALVDSDTLADGSVVRLDNPINDGNRLVIDKDFIDDYILPAITPGTGDKSVWVGFGKETGGSADWSNGVSEADFELAFEFFSDDASRSSNNWRLRVFKQGTQISNVGVGGQTSGLYNYVFVNDGGTIKIGGLLPSYGDATSFVWSSTDFSWEEEVTGLATQNRELYIGTDNVQMDLPNPFADVTEVAEPAPAATILTNWTKALDFSGSNEHAKQVNRSTFYNPINCGSKSTTVPNNTDSGKTSNSTNARPWATTMVFQVDRHSSNQHIWNSGEGAASGNDNIYTRLSASGKLYFGWGREGVGYNECEIYDISYGQTGDWFGLYIAHKGGRFSTADATAANLADAFDIRLMTSDNGDNFATVGSNLSTTANWGSTGVRMDREIYGYLTVGGRASNRNFHGKVASMVVTTLKINQTMPTDNEISKMVTDPVKWVQNFKVGNDFRGPYNQYNTSNWGMNSAAGSQAVQVWLMGDGASDSYANGMRNYVYPADQNNTKMQLNSMVSNDIENVNIPGLS